jgi:hypothetical protein
VRRRIGRHAIVGTALTLTGLAAGADPAAWKVVGESGGELTLLGSMHYLSEAEYPLPAALDRLYDGADVIIMELDLDDLNATQQQASLLQAAVLPPGTGLEDVLGDEAYRLAEQRAQALGIELGLLARFKPWLVAITLLDQGMNRLGYRAEHGLEQYLLGKARRDGKQVLGLESLEAQVGIFAGLSDAEQQALLEQTLDELAAPAVEISELAAAWRDGRLDELAADLEADFEDFPGLYDALIVDRNAQWIGALEQRLTDGKRYLVVVGALHLVGSDSVIETLEARGHTVERIH